VNERQAGTFVGRLYRRLVERRILPERRFGQPGILHRLIYVRFASALMLSAPALAMCIWYAYLAYSAHVRYENATGFKEPLTAELFQLHLHDRLSQDLRRLTMPQPLRKSALPTYGLVVANDELARLDELIPPSDGKSYYVKAFLTSGRDTLPARVRYRGSRHWHWNYPQKSWKVRLDSGVMLDGRVAFNFINTPEPMPFDEQMILDIGREHGLLAPDYFPFRLLLNKAYLGVYFFANQPDEGMLRGASRFPGSIYSGNDAPTDKKTGVSSLWQSAKYWKKVASSGPRYSDDFGELEALLRVVNTGSPQEFADFAEQYLDLEKFALFDALDVVFGCNNHDFGENHKLYFDPYRARFEPIAWNFRGVKHQPLLNRTEHPLLLRLKQLPHYLTLRNRNVYDLLRGSCSNDALRRRMQTLLDRLAADQIRDPYWDAYQLLPSVSPYYRQLVRPMDRFRQAAATETFVNELAERELFLLTELSRQEVGARLLPLAASRGATAGKDSTDAFALDLTVGGNSGIRLGPVKPIWPRSCKPERWQLYADTNLNDNLDPESDRALTSVLSPDEAAEPTLELFPATQLIARRLHPNRGAVRSTDAPERYRLLVSSPGCRAERVIVQATSEVTGAPFRVEAEARPRAPTPDPIECAAAPPEVEPGQLSPHPWCLRHPHPESITFGPGMVELDKTLVFGRQQTVTIAPGTTFYLGKKASLIFFGRVEAVGSKDAPIRFVPRDKRWGGIVVQGHGSAGSRFRHALFRKGTTVQWGLGRYPAMVNVHDTTDIDIEHCLFEKNEKSEDALHATYVQNLTLRDSLFRKSAADAIDIEFSSGRVERVTATESGDEPLDLMGSQVVVRGCRFVDFGGSGVSAGEESNVILEDTLIAQGTHGLLVKNASTASVRGTLLYWNRVGVRLEVTSVWYSGKARLRGGPLHVVRCAKPVQVAGGSAKRVKLVSKRLDDNNLKRLRTEVLGLKDWGELDGRIGELHRRPSW
jgi:hypothetical protein